jgi:hypothetical protein
VARRVTKTASFMVDGMVSVQSADVEKSTNCIDDVGTTCGEKRVSAGRNAELQKQLLWCFSLLIVDTHQSKSLRQSSVQVEFLGFAVWTWLVWIEKFRGCF